MAQYTVRYFAAAAEAAGTEQECFDSAQAPTLDALRAALAERYGASMARVLRGGSFLVDGTVRRGGDLRIGADGAAVVDVLPPFAGG
ncbi:MoaD/ThiS family protein [Leucobacter sp. wl10]|uniref:MoaD/ThiS family protein n=1 Tax=Leucobacter sp. wl10 TaxID=2304677 RepID=UPI000E5ACBF7|nr:MoaD/ThiS family protein [Leucobacter sp. wl10]RGE21115.1 MoaD/ThiS family protein [Leucobacter sp. wl10]